MSVSSTVEVDCASGWLPLTDDVLLVLLLAPVSTEEYLRMRRKRRLHTTLATPVVGRMAVAAT